MCESLSIRAYRPVELTHSHNFHQVVVPLHGVIDISLNNLNGVVSPGHCIVIKKNVEHSFRAENDARFLVVDLNELPDAALSLKNPFASISSAFRSFCLFSEAQIQSQSDPALEQAMVCVFRQLLSSQDFQPKIDPRIARAIAHIERHLSDNYNLLDLASIASLSVSQFKILFVKCTGKTASQYVLMLRMERARALLVNTDTPMSIVAELSGYTDNSAFSRRFRKYYGVAPSQYRKKQRAP